MEKNGFVKVLITGASSGLGLHLAREFVSSGYSVWGIGRRKLEPGTPGLSSEQGFRYSQCDTTVKEQVVEAVRNMVKADFIPDIAVFCSGNAVEDITEDIFNLNSFKENFDINLYGALNWVEALLPFFLKRKKGTFVGISSMSIYRENHKKRIAYSASKLALSKSFENLRLEYYPLGIRFVIFNMGRMKEKSDLIGTSYSKAAKSIARRIKSERASSTFNIPYTQYLLTLLARFMPEGIFRKYLMK